MRGLGYTIGMISQRPRSMVEGLLAEATVVNDLSTATFSNASANRWDPYNRAYAGVNGRRRRPMLRAARRIINGDHIEPARTNLALRSQDFNNASWTKTDFTVTSGAATAPDGTTTADLIVEGSAGTASIQQSPTVTAAAVVVWSCHFKALSGNAWVLMRVTSNAGVNGARAWFNISTGAVGTVTTLGTGSGIRAFIESAGNGFYRCMMVALIDPAATAATCGFQSAAADASLTRVFACAYNAWGGQVEPMLAGATTGYASTYTATTSATVTRAADVLTVPYVLGQTGTLLALCIPGWTGDQDGVTAYRVWGANDTQPSRMVRASATQVIFRRGDAGGGQGGNLTHALVNGSLNHLGMAWDSAAITPFSNGVAQVADTSLTPPYDVNTTLGIGQTTAGTAQFSGPVALLAWPRALSAGEHLAFFNAFSALV